MKTKHQYGSAAIEFALVLPLFITLFLGVIEISIGLYDKAVITNASREAARAGILLRSPKPSVTDLTKIIVDTATRYCSDNLITFGNANDPVVSVPVISQTFGSPLSVTVSYQYKGIGFTPIFNAVTGQRNLTAITVMNNE
jgi:Flp pilus assembly protein TadG